MSVVISEIDLLKHRLTEIEERLPKLNFLQFKEKKKLKADQEKLTNRLAKLNSLVQEMKMRFERETNLANNRYNKLLRGLELSFK